MNTDSARRARRKAIKTDLASAYTDEEAAPPEWLDLFNTVRDETASIRADIERETKGFVTEPDIRVALARRERTAAAMRGRVEKLNGTIKRLNLISPHARFTRAALRADEVLRPLYRAARPG